jgi:hypothetical protein
MNYNFLLHISVDLQVCYYSFSTIYLIIGSNLNLFDITSKFLTVAMIVTAEL